MKRGNHSKSRFPKALALVLAMVLLVGAAIGGTVAWLTDKTGDVVNTFTVGNIDIELAESTGSQYKMIPGYEHTKDPIVTVKTNSEPCWVFVQVTTQGKAVVDGVEKGIADYLDFSVDTADGKWIPLDGHDGVYYQQIGVVDDDPLSADLTLPVLTGNKVTVKDTVTKAMMDALGKEGAVQPKMTFKAYAIQQYGFATADAGWHELNDLPDHVSTP